MKIFNLLVVAILFVPLVMASTPNYDVSLILEDEVKNGVYDFGDILFVEKPYISDHHPRSQIQNDTFQQHDILDWSGQSVKINNPLGEQSILVSGSEYYFSESGIYTIESMLNSSIKDFIVITSEDDNKINISDIDTPKGFALNLTKTNFVLNGELNVGVEIIIDDDVKKGLYDVSFDVNDETFTHELRVLENLNWTYDDTNLSKESTIKAGEGFYLGRVIVENGGNTDVEIVVKKTGNSTDMLGIPQPQTLYRKNVINLDFQAQVPTIRKSGIYNYEIIIQGGGITKKIPLNITVQDSIKPIIESIEFSSDRVFVDNTIKVVATDNDEVETVVMTIGDTKHELEKDKNVFTIDYQFNKLSRYMMDFCAYDVEDNKACESINKTFIRKEIIKNHTDVLNMDSMRYGKYSRIYLFNITDEIDGGALLRLISVDSNSDIDPVIRVVDKDGSIKNFGEYDSEVTLNKVGEYFLEVRGDEEMDVTGVLRLDLLEQYEPISDITFKVSFKEYDVPKPFTVEWVSGRDLICKVEDTGNLDTSYYDCSLRYPIDTRSEDVSIPTTVAEKNKLESEADDVRDEMEKNKNKSAWIIGIMIAMFFILIIWSLVMIHWFPLVRMQTGKTKNNING